jgi:hypothetical protein
MAACFAGEHNCWFKVKVNMCRRHKYETGLVFKHPTTGRRMDGAAEAPGDGRGEAEVRIQYIFFRLINSSYLA